MKASKAVVDSMVRAQVISNLGFETNDQLERMSNQSFSGVIEVEVDGETVRRAYEVRVIATAPLEGVTAEEQHFARVQAYKDDVAEKAKKAAEKAEAKAKKIASDKAKRERKKEGN